MKYLILNHGKPFFTTYYDKQNHFVEGMIIIDPYTDRYSIDGGDTWMPIEDDEL